MRYNTCFHPIFNFILAFGNSTVLKSYVYLNLKNNTMISQILSIHFNFYPGANNKTLDIVRYNTCFHPIFNSNLAFGNSTVLKSYVYLNLKNHTMISQILSIHFNFIPVQIINSA